VELITYGDHSEHSSSGFADFSSASDTDLSLSAFLCSGLSSAGEVCVGPIPRPWSLPNVQMFNSFKISSESANVFKELVYYLLSSLDDGDETFFVEQ
jgi:hypothetical protein